MALNRVYDADLDDDMLGVVLSVSEAITVQTALKLAMEQETVTPYNAGRVLHKLDKAIDQWFVAA